MLAQRDTLGGGFAAPPEPDPPPGEHAPPDGGSASRAFALVLGDESPGALRPRVGPPLRDHGSATRG